jgi:adenosylhomocysteine nucleosidase
MSGVGPQRARKAFELIAGEPPALVIAAGFCGALQSGPAVGGVIVPEAVVDPSGRSWPCARTSRQGTDRLLTTSHLVTTAIEKVEIGVRSGASVVDMESATIADLCAARQIPFAAVRSVSDTVDTELSPALVRLLSGGKVSVWKAVWALVRKPSLFGEFRRLARDTRRASQTLATELAAVVTTFRGR